MLLPQALLLAAGLASVQQPTPAPVRDVPRVDLRVDAPGADVVPWAREFILNIDRNWMLPPDALGVRGHVVVTFDVGRDGKIDKLEIVSPALSDALNAAARNAIEQASAEQRTPSNYPDDGLHVAATIFHGEQVPAQPVKIVPPPGVDVPGPAVTAPLVIHDVHAAYTPDAMRARIQGAVILGCVVGVDGRVHDVKLLRPLDPWFGLDVAAMDAAGEWTFRPGTKNGVAVPVYVTIEMTFTLH